MSWFATQSVLGADVEMKCCMELISGRQANYKSNNQEGPLPDSIRPNRLLHPLGAGVGP
jgi:hypothetical protein